MELQMFAPILGVVGFVIAIVLYHVVKAEPVGNARMEEIGDDIYNGAMAFLGREYRVLAIFIVIVFCLIAVGMNIQTALAFLGGSPQRSTGYYAPGHRRFTQFGNNGRGSKSRRPGTGIRIA